MSGLPIGRSLTYTGAWLVRRAKSLARRLQLSRQMSRHEVIDGFLIRAQRVGQNAVGTVIDPPGRILCLNQKDQPHISSIYSVAPRDAYSTAANRPDGPHADPAALGERQAVGISRAIGFTPGELLDLLVAARFGAQHTAQGRFIHDRGILAIQPQGTFYPAATGRGDMAYQYRTEALRYGAGYDLGAADLSNTPGGRSGYVVAQEAIDELAPGYRLLSLVDTAALDAGYVSYEYHGGPACVADIGATTLLVVPVVNNTGQEDSAVHWGDCGLLFLLLNDDPAREGAESSVLLWSRLWTPAEHPIDFFHPGPWLARPYPDPNPAGVKVSEQWEAFWDAWTGAGEPNPAGGSRPVWVDTMSAAGHGDRFVVNLRLVALNGVRYEPEPGSWTYQMAGGESHLRFELPILDADGQLLEAFELQQEVAHYEVHAASNSIDPPGPGAFEQWVDGHLPADTVLVRYPLHTMTVGERLVEVRYELTADRLQMFSGGNPRGMQAELGADRLVVDVTDADGTLSSWPIPFISLGAGIQGPLLEAGTNGGTTMLYWVVPAAGGSYKLQSFSGMFCQVAEHEIGFILYTNWQALPLVPSTSGPARQAKFCVLNLVTGNCGVRGELPFRHCATISHSAVVQLSCIQREVRAAGAAPTDPPQQFGVLLATYGEESNIYDTVLAQPAVFISRDSGATWQPYLEFPSARNGAFFIGNSLQGGVAPGQAVMRQEE